MKKELSTEDIKELVELKKMLDELSKTKGKYKTEFSKEERGENENTNS